jgi:RNA polymerase sigma factor (sigma-70 family)
VNRATGSPEREESDRRLVARFLAVSDHASFRRLYEAQTPRLYLWLLRLTGGREAEAEELLQETWLRAVESLPRFRWESSLATWLHGIAANVRREAARDRRILVPLDLVAFSGPGPDRTGGAEKVDVERAVRELPDGFREVLVLHDLEGYTHEQIAAMLGIAPGTSKSQLSRARRSLRRALGGTRRREEEADEGNR